MPACRALWSAGLLLLASAAAGQAGLLPPPVPGPRFEGSAASATLWYCCGAAVATPGGVYYLGGWDGWRHPDGGISFAFHADVLRYVTASDRLEATGHLLPPGLTYSSAFWDGRDRPEAGCGGGCAYVLGGWDGWGHGEVNVPRRTDLIVRYNPADGAVVVLPERLLSPRGGMGLVWTGEHAYLFGGYGASGPLSEILRYDPISGEVAKLGASLPEAAYGSGTVCAGTKALIFGGARGDFFNDPQVLLRTVVEVDLVTGTVATKAAKLPEPRYKSSAVWTGSAAYILGGASGPNGVLRYLPVVDHIESLDVGLPSGFSSMPLAWKAGSAFLLGAGDTGAAPYDAAMRVFKPGVPDEALPAGDFGICIASPALPLG